MRKTDLCAARQKLLVPVDGYSGAFALIPPPAPRFLQLKGLKGEVTRALDALDYLKLLSAGLPNPDLVTRTSDRREAVRSSQIEGTNSDVSDLLIYEATGSGEGLPPDVRVTHNYVMALEYGLQKVRQRGISAITCNLIKELHAHLMSGVDDFKGIPGEFRDKQNWIGGVKIDHALFVPPPHGNVQACMDDLELLLQYTPAEEDQFEIPIVIRMAIAHAQFETIHPFIDGNGRVGRILLPLMLAAEDFPPVYLAGFLKDNQREYYDALAGVQLKEKWSEWIRFFAIGVHAAVQESIKTALGLEEILKKWKTIVAGLGLRSHSVVHKLPELMIGTPVLTAHQAKDALGISFPSASSALALLEEKGILVQQVKHQRNRTFIAKEVIDLLNRPA